MTNNKASKNALKGYSYQQQIINLFVGMMDVERKIVKVETEADGVKNFDDIVITMYDGTTYCFQIKNFEDKKTIEKIDVCDDYVKIGKSKSYFSSKNNNVIVINNDETKTDYSFLNLPALKYKEIIVIPLTNEKAEERLELMYKRNYKRKSEIIKAVSKHINKGKFTISIGDLPKLENIPILLEQTTINVRRIPQEICKGVTHVVGKPGIGKSHYVEEIKRIHSDKTIIYRFWTGSQDPFYTERLNFDVFLRELGIMVFNSPRDFSIDELINQIEIKNKIVVIDGLDHVENYRREQIQEYIEFIDKLSNTKARVMVLSRPLRTATNWNKKELPNWTYEETRVYLSKGYNINNYDLCNKIFKITKGYPIITHFLAEHYKQNGVFNLEIPVEDINQYYSKLLEGEKSNALSVFAISNSFFTFQEIEKFLGKEVYGYVKEYIDKHQYLFEIIENRVSLIHDSFNTYLRENIVNNKYKSYLKKTLNEVQESLLSGDIEYMARILCFPFKESFLKKLLKKYCNFYEFEKLLQSTIDFNSISSFYFQLQSILKTSKGILNIYEYYSFSLIFQAATKEDLIEYNGLVYNILTYIKKHNKSRKIENQVFSSGIIWNVFLILKNERKYEQRVKNFFVNSIYNDEDMYEQIISNIKYEKEYLKYKERQIEKYADAEKLLKDINEKAFVKSDMLKGYLLYLYIHRKYDNVLFGELEKYIENKSSYYFFVNHFNKYYYIPEYITEDVLNSTVKTIHTYGFLGQKNVYFKKSIYERLNEIAPDGSYNVIKDINSLIRLALYNNEKIDINNINYIWTMYQQRKDRSVYTIEKALIIFEKKGLISYRESLEVIFRLMNQSEKGIRHLMTSYINTKGYNFYIKIKNSGEFLKYQSHINVEQLFINEGKASSSTKEKSLLNRDYIIEEDEIYIKKNNIDALTISKYTNGYHVCLPFPQFYNIYDKDYLQKSYLEILHEAMFALIVRLQEVGEWYFMLGNIPEFIEICGIKDINWNKIFNVFKNYLRISHIYFPEKTV